MDKPKHPGEDSCVHLDRHHTFGEDAEFVKITRRVRQQLLNANLGWKVLHQSLNLGSAVFGTGSEVDDKIKSDMRAAHSGAQSSTER